MTLPGDVTPANVGPQTHTSNDRKKEEETPHSPWCEPRSEDPKQRVVGWRAGVGLTAQDVREILRKERPARHEYKSVRKAIARSRAREVTDPLAGLPPTWQAFWSTVPHLDPQAAYKQHCYALAKEGKANKTKDGKDGQGQVAVGGEPVGPEGQADGDTKGRENFMDIEAETVKLEAEVKAKKEALSAKEGLCAEWDKKLGKVRQLDREEEERSRKLIKRLESVSYTHGILEGKIRSSDTYFQFLYSDAAAAHKKQVMNLIKSNALIGQQIGATIEEVRVLIKAHQEEANPESSSVHHADTAGITA